MRPPALETLPVSSATRLRLHRADTDCESTEHLADGDELAKVVQLHWELARAAQSGWSSEKVQVRLDILRKLRAKIAGNPQALANTVHRKSLAETLAAEVLPLLDACRFLEKEASKFLQEKVVGQRGRPNWLWGNSVVLRPEPLGTVLIIGPGNYPLMLPGIQALQAIAAGNTVLIKPAVDCSPAMQMLVSMAISVGLPEGVMQVLPESSEAAALTIRKGVDKVFLTGSANTGRAVSRELAETMTPSVMELSGCDAVFVLEDADLELVSDCLLFGLTLNESQTCMAPRRVFARDGQADILLRLLKEKLVKRGMITANELDSGNLKKRMPATSEVAMIGCPPSAVSPDSLKDRQIAAALSEGAELVVGCLGAGSQAEFSKISILDRVTSDMSLVQTDLFAPVLSFIRVESDSQALQENANCPFALCATLFGSPARCRHFARRIPAGCVVVNDMIVPTADPRVPFGGRGMSGHGKTRGQAGLLEMTQLKAIVTNRRWFKPHLHQPTAVDSEVLEQLIRLEHATSPLQSLMAVPKIIKASLEQRRLRGSIGVQKTSRR